MLRRAEVVGWKQPRNPPMSLGGVRVAIVVGARERRVQGEGPPLEGWVRSNPPACSGGEYRSLSGEHSEPEILSGGRRVRCKSHARWQRGGWRDGSKDTARCPCPLPMGQRPYPMVSRIPEDVRGWLLSCASLKEVRGQPDIPADRSGFRDERLGSMMSHHLTTSVEYIVVNVGGSGMDAKVSSPPMPYQSVGGVIVLGGRASRLQGEGRQGIDAVPV
jgi:hypothetical protein